MKHQLCIIPILLVDSALLDGKYQVRGKVKSGGFGSVYLAKGVQNDHHIYAVKFIPKKYQKYAEIQSQLYEMFRREEYTHGFVKVSFFIKVAFRSWVYRKRVLFGDGTLTILDDIESFLYSLIYLMTGSLPWMSIKVQSQADYHKIKLSKQKLSENWLKQRKIPLQIYETLLQIRACKNPPQFDYLKCKFQLLSALEHIHEQNDFIFDWCTNSKNQKNQNSKKQQQQKAEMIKQNRAEEYKKKAEGKKPRPMSATNQGKQKLSQQQMHIDNKKIIDHEAFEIYKFLEKEEIAETPPSRLKQQQQNRIIQMDSNKEIIKKQVWATQSKTQKWSASSNRDKKIRANFGYTQLNRELQKKMKAFQSMKFEGPRIAINHQKL